ncbi:MAG: hypothetical protein ACTSYD_12550 [Candidatus Heimdallarchaeaceae archaeon]
MNSNSNRFTSILERSLPLIRKCREENISIDLLITTLRLIDRGMLKNYQDIEFYLSKRAKNSPLYQVQAEKIKEMIASSFADDFI